MQRDTGIVFHNAKQLGVVNIHVAFIDTIKTLLYWLMSSFICVSLFIIRVGMARACAQHPVYFCRHHCYHLGNL